METRTSKYNNNDDNNLMSRTKRNQSLYNEINDLSIDTFDVNSNSEILSNNGTTIDIERLKSMLDKKYREEPRSKSLGEINNDEGIEDIKLNETREYDINQILSKAKEEKNEDDYEVERLKKLRNTQVNILSDLNIDNLKKEDIQVKAVSDREGEELRTLIDTINLTESTNTIKDLDPLDLFSDLKGDDDETKVKGISELTDELAKIRENENIKVNNEKKEEVKDELENSFYTTSSILKKEDFDDFADLKDDINATKVIVRILIVVVILAFICGVVFLLNNILEWGLF